jgi:hypothetical protein
LVRFLLVADGGGVAQEWLADGITKGTVHNEYGSRVLKLDPPAKLAIGMDVVERRTRNREKLKKQAAKMLYEQPWQHDPHLQEDHTLKVLTNYLISKPFYGKCAEANDISQHTPSWIICDKASPFCKPLVVSFSLGLGDRRRTRCSASSETRWTCICATCCCRTSWASKSRPRCAATSFATRRWPSTAPPRSTRRARTWAPPSCITTAR